MQQPRTAMFEALGDPTRDAIVNLLLEGERSVGAIADRLPVSRPAVSKHLRLLAGAGLVRFRRMGAQSLYSIDPEALVRLRAEIDGMWRHALNRYALLANNAPSDA